MLVIIMLQFHGKKRKENYNYLQFANIKQIKAFYYKIENPYRKELSSLYAWFSPPALKPGFTYLLLSTIYEAQKILLNRQVFYFCH